MENLKKNPLSLQLNVEDFAPASNDEKKSLVVMRESVNFWKDGMRRLRKNKIAMVSLVVILLIAFMAYVLPSFWPYSYEQQIKGSNNLAPFEYSAAEQKLIDQGENVFPHILGTDRMGRDFAVRVMMGTRVSLSVGLLASVLVLLIGATYGAISAFAGGWIDNIMMRITDILYTIPDILLIILLAMAIKEPLEGLATKPGFGWMQKLPGPDAEGERVRHRCPRAGCLRRAHHQEAPADELHGHPDRHHHPADPVLHLHRELPELPRPRRCSPHAVPRLAGD